MSPEPSSGLQAEGTDREEGTPVEESLSSALAGQLAREAREAKALARAEERRLKYEKDLAELHVELAIQREKERVKAAEAKAHAAQLCKHRRRLPEHGGKHPCKRCAVEAEQRKRRERRLAKRWRKANPEKVRAAVRRRIRRPVPRFAAAQENAKARGLEFALTFDEWIDLASQPCFFQQQASEPLDLHPPMPTGSGLARIDPAIGFVKSNVVPVCRACSYGMKRRSFADWLAQFTSDADVRPGVDDGEDPAPDEPEDESLVAPWDLLDGEGPEGDPEPEEPEDGDLGDEPEEDDGVDLGDEPGEDDEELARLEAEELAQADRELEEFEREFGPLEEDDEWCDLLATVARVVAVDLGAGRKGGLR